MVENKVEVEKLYQPEEGDGGWHGQSP